MKHALLSFILFQSSNYCFSQNIALNKIDEFTDEKIIQVNASQETEWTGSDNIAKGLFNYIFISSKSIESKKGITLFTQLDVRTGGMICLSAYYGKVIFLLENDEKITLNQISKVDCGEHVLGQFILNKDDLDKLSNFLIKKFRIYTADGYIDFETKTNRQELIKKHFLLFKQTINQ